MPEALQPTEDTQTIEERVIALIKDYLAENENHLVTPNAYFSDIAVDSLEKLDLIQTIETEMQVRIASEKLESILTVRDLIKEVEDLRAYRPL